MGQDGAAHNGQVRVGTHEVVGELPDEIQELAEAGPVNFHGGVLPVEADAVLVVIDIRGVLQKPGRAVDGDGDHPVVLPCGVVHTAGVALVLQAELAAGVVGGGKVPGGGNGLGVLFRLGEVNGDVQLPVLREGLPLHVFGDAVPADVVGILAECIVPVCGGLGVPGAQGLEHLDHLGGAGSQAAHDFRVEEIPVDHGVFRQHAPRVGVVQQLLQHGGQFQAGWVPGMLRFRIAVQL